MFDWLSWCELKCWRLLSATPVRPLQFLHVIYSADLSLFIGKLWCKNWRTQFSSFAIPIPTCRRAMRSLSVCHQMRVVIGIVDFIGSRARFFSSPQFECRYLLRFLLSNQPHLMLWRETRAFQSNRTRTEVERATQQHIARHINVKATKNQTLSRSAFFPFWKRERNIKRKNGVKFDGITRRWACVCGALQTVHCTRTHTLYIRKSTSLWTQNRYNFLKLIAGKCSLVYNAMVSGDRVYAIRVLCAVCTGLEKPDDAPHDGIGPIAREWEINVANIHILDINRRVRARVLHHNVNGTRECQLRAPAMPSKHYALIPITSNGSCIRKPRVHIFNINLWEHCEAIISFVHDIYGKLQLNCVPRTFRAAMCECVCVCVRWPQHMTVAGEMTRWAHIQFIIKLYGIWRRQTVASQS